MNGEVLEELGLSRNETRAYLALLALKEARIANIAHRAGIHRSNCYDSLEKLAEKGLVEWRAQAGTKVYRCASPKRFEALLAERQELLGKAMPALLEAYAAPPVERDAMVLAGWDGVKRMLDETTAAKRRFLMVNFGELAALEDPRYASYASLRFLRMIRRMPRKCFDYRLLWADTPLSRERLREFYRKYSKKGVKNPERFLPMKPTGNTFWLADDLVFFSFFREADRLSDYVCVRIASASLADALAQTFDHLWKDSRP